MWMMRLGEGGWIAIPQNDDFIASSFWGILRSWSIRLCCHLRTARSLQDLHQINSLLLIWDPIWKNNYESRWKSRILNFFVRPRSIMRNHNHGKFFNVFDLSITWVTFWSSQIRKSLRHITKFFFKFTIACFSRLYHNLKSWIPRLQVPISFSLENFTDS